MRGKIPVVSNSIRNVTRKISHRDTRGRVCKTSVRKCQSSIVARFTNTCGRHIDDTPTQMSDDFYEWKRSSIEDILSGSSQMREGIFTSAGNLEEIKNDGENETRREGWGDGPWYKSASAADSYTTTQKLAVENERLTRELGKCQHKLWDTRRQLCEEREFYEEQKASFCKMMMRKHRVDATTQTLFYGKSKRSSMPPLNPKPVGCKEAIRLNLEVKRLRAILCKQKMLTLKLIEKFVKLVQKKDVLEAKLKAEEKHHKKDVKELMTRLDEQRIDFELAEKKPTQNLQVLKMELERLLKEKEAENLLLRYQRKRKVKKKVVKREQESDSEEGTIPLEVSGSVISIAVTTTSEDGSSVVKLTPMFEVIEETGSDVKEDDSEEILNKSVSWEHQDSKDSETVTHMEPDPPPDNSDEAAVLQVEDQHTSSSPEFWERWQKTEEWTRSVEGGPCYSIVARTESAPDVMQASLVKEPG